MNLRITFNALALLAFLTVPAGPVIAAETGASQPRAYTYGTKDIPEGISAEHYDAKFSPPSASKDISVEELLALDPRSFPHIISVRLSSQR